MPSVQPKSKPPKTRQHLDPRFSHVGEVFDALIASGAEPGAAVSVWHDGKCVVDLAGGWRDNARTRPWTTHTLAMVYSTGKPVAALAALTAAKKGLLTLDDPVVRWWPEYGRQGKEGTTLRHILSHTAGVPAFSAEALKLDPLDKRALIEDLAAHPAEFSPGTELAEHALTYGHLIDGLLASAEAPTVAQAVRSLSQELEVDMWFGIPDAQQARVADLEVIDPGWVSSYLDQDLASRALSAPIGRLDPQHVNSPESRRASFPADGLFTSASSLAKFYADLPLVDGRLATLLGPALHAEFLAPQATGFDRFLMADASWSLGLRISNNEYGMGGIGGSCAWYSPRLNYAMAYVTRGLGGFDRADAVADAAEDVLRTLRKAG